MKKLTINTSSSLAIVIALTGSVSAGGLADAVTEASVAEPTTICAPSRSLDLRVGALQSDNVWEDEIETRGFDDSDKVGLGDVSDTAKGEFAELSYNWDRCDSSLTFGAGFASTDLGEDGDGTEPSRIEDETTLAYLDVAYGRPLNDQVRYFAGLRILNFESESSLLAEPFFPVESEAESSFTGIGPIVGISYETPNRARGEFGFFGKASVAALFGAQRNEEQGDAFGLEETTDESNETILSFDAELGAFYNVTDNSAVSLGVSYKHLNDIDFVSGNLAEPDDVSFETGDREFVGAFLGYSYRF